MASSKTAKKTPAKKSPKPPSERSKFEKFNMVEVERSQLKGAPYNPRIISDTAKKRLRDGIRKMGLVQPIVWNSASGNIVGGHQRLTQLDMLEGSPNYRLTVAEVNVTAATEKELNILLNNPQAQGDWDLELLKELLSDEDLEIENTGFDPAEVFKLFGSDDLERAPSQALESLGNKAQELKDIYSKLEEEREDKDDPDYYLVVVFKSYTQRKQFTDAVGLDDNRYASGSTLLDLIEE